MASRPKRPARRPRRRRQPWWSALPLEELLDVRLCDLDLTIDGTAIAARIERLHDELQRKGLRFRPYVWLSTDWFTPEGSTGFAVPFYLAHPRLVRVEHAMMFEAEGSTHDWCMKLLRHEAGHALDNAFLLHWHNEWRSTFGRYSTPYRTAYSVDPTSRKFVQHLGWWYAQSHPAEDWAETFAVWLAPGSGWRAEYDGWPALRKLEAVDGMMTDIAGEQQEVRSRDRPESLSRQRITLREHYRRRQLALRREPAWRLDEELRLLFGDAAASSRREHAARFLRARRHELRGSVSSMTGQHRYIVDQTLDAMEQRCRELGLRLTRPRTQTLLGAAVLATRATLQLATGHRPRFHR